MYIFNEYSVYIREPSIDNYVWVMERLVWYSPFGYNARWGINIPCNFHHNYLETSRNQRNSNHLLGSTEKTYLSTAFASAYVRSRHIPGMAEWQRQRRTVIYLMPLWYRDAWQSPFLHILGSWLPRLRRPRRRNCIYHVGFLEHEAIKEALCALFGRATFKVTLRWNRRTHAVEDASRSSNGILGVGD